MTDLIRENPTPDPNLGLSAAIPAIAFVDNPLRWNGGERLRTT